MIPVESDNGHLTANPAPSSLNFQSRSFIYLRSTPGTASMLTSGWPLSRMIPPQLGLEELWPYRSFWKIQQVFLLHWEGPRPALMFSYGKHYGSFLQTRRCIRSKLTRW